MEVEEAIEKRRSFRSLKKIEITDEMITKLGTAAQLMCSCYNNQPWRFVFVYQDPILTDLKNVAINPGNRWAKDGSMIIVVFSKPDLDCIIGEKNYYLFDTGMAVGAMLLEATNLGLIAHPIAGFKPEKVHEILEIPSEFNIITLLIIGKKNPEIPEFFKDYQIKSEQKRPTRKELSEFIFQNQYKPEDEEKKRDLS